MLSHQQIMTRPQRAVVQRSPSSSEITTQQQNKGWSLIQAIQKESGEPGLLRALQALVMNVREASNEKDKKAGGGIKGVLKRVLQPFSDDDDEIGYTPSHEPEGAAWTVGALIKNLEQMTGLTPTNTKAIKELLSLPLSHQRTMIRGIIESLLSANAPVNDRHNTFEAVMKILATMGPAQDDLIFAVTQPLIDTFYNDIHKPFINFVGYNFRSADGSYNSVWFPDAGKAGTNYTRTVTPTSMVNENLPSPAEVFNRILKRQTFTPHKAGINMLLFYLATIITHDLFYTDPKNPMRNLTTSYADLSPLYGFNRKDQESVRQMKGGLLKPDQWFDKRLVIQPPGVGALMVLFSRNHNYIAKTLLEKNENGQFSYGPGQALATEEEQDEKLFQTARLINNACYINIILHEYVRTIVGASPDSYFVLNPLATPSWPVYGNAVSVEFNFVYRWHMALGKEDTEWLDSVMALLGQTWESQLSSSSSASTNGQGGTDLTNGTVQGVFEALLPAFNDAFVHASPEELALGLPIAGAHRDLKTGRFTDFHLAQFLRRGYQQIASELGNGGNTPAAFARVEMAGIMQGRQLKTCTFNDLRRHLNLTPLTSFEDFSEKPEIQQALKELYGTPDQVELYTGLMVERNKVTGLRLPYTMGRAILSDAVNLLRNDRIASQELTPANLTNWGYNYAKGDPKQYGRVLPDMIRRLLPEANANQQPAFSDEEMKYLFNVPKNNNNNSVQSA